MPMLTTIRYFAVLGEKCKPKRTLTMAHSLYRNIQMFLVNVRVYPTSRKKEVATLKLKVNGFFISRLPLSSRFAARLKLSKLEPAGGMLVT